MGAVAFQRRIHLLAPTPRWAAAGGVPADRFSYIGDSPTISTVMWRASIPECPDADKQVVRVEGVELRIVLPHRGMCRRKLVDALIASRRRLLLDLRSIEGEVANGITDPVGSRQHRYGRGEDDTRRVDHPDVQRRDHAEALAIFGSASDPAEQLISTHEGSEPAPLKGQVRTSCL